MVRLALALSLFSAAQARAADYALILNDAERAALLEIINEAVKARGLDIAANAVILASKVRAAGVATEQKSEPPKTEPPGDATKEPPR